MQLSPVEEVIDLIFTGVEQPVHKQTQDLGCGSWLDVIRKLQQSIAV